MADTQDSRDALESPDAFFTRVVRQHARLLYRVAHGILRNPADAEDAVADAMLKLLRSGAWRAITNERAFLARTVWRVALDRLEARRLVPDSDAVLQGLQDDRPTPEHRAVQSSSHELLHTLIDQLPPDLRDPLLLSAVEELNSREIGEVMNLPEGTVRTRLMRARKELKAQFETLQNARGREVAARGAPR